MLPPEPSGQEYRWLARAFPAALASDVIAAASIIPAAAHEPVGEFTVWVDGEELVLPSRIYNAEPDPGAVDKLTPRAQLVTHCLYTRHHDGYLRQRNLEQVVRAPDAWVVPYVVKLVGEYVVQIIEVIKAALPQLTVPGSHQRALYGRFAAENAAFVDLTTARVASYWDAYYRGWYRSLTDYPGRALIDAIRAAGLEYSTARSQRSSAGAASPDHQT